MHKLHQHTNRAPMRLANQCWWKICCIRPCCTAIYGPLHARLRHAVWLGLPMIASKALDVRGKAAVSQLQHT